VFLLHEIDECPTLQYFDFDGIKQHTDDSSSLASELTSTTIDISVRYWHDLMGVNVMPVFSQKDSARNER